ncbi:MAG: hypothetical protein H0V64_15440, partial [Geodermatophilaceae bacterium]|nr:hypothetical protein [Geodermatophilaceae bacterium]
MSCRAAVTVFVVTLGLMVGCTGEDPAAGLPSSAPSSTPSSTATTAEVVPETSVPTTPVVTGAPALPAEAQEQTPDGAAAFVQHWYDTL